MDLLDNSEPVSVPEDSGDAGDGGKLKMIVSLVKKCLGVKDIASMRLSLPASLLEPIPNLEYWHYLDRPDFFASINDSHDPFVRLIAVLRFALSKDLKFVHGKVCKPYNSVLGEHFRAHWDVIPGSFNSGSNSNLSDNASTTTPSSTVPPSPVIPDFSETASVKSGRSSRSGLSLLSRTARSSTSTAGTSPQTHSLNNIAAHMSNLSLGRPVDTIPEHDGDLDSNMESPRARIVYVTEQVSHHPPVSAYFAVCPSRHVEMAGVDQISAKVSGTTVRVAPGQYNQGIYINLTGGPGEGESYHITHPVAYVNGILRGSFYITVGESSIITCEGYKGRKGFRVIIEYKEESWLGKPHFLLEGVVHTVFDGESQHEEWTKVRHVPTSRIVAVFDGSWRGKIRWRRVGMGSFPDSLSSTASSPAGSHVHLPLNTTSELDVSSGTYGLLPGTVPSASAETEYSVLVDLAVLRTIPKTVRPLERQQPYESRKLWDGVTRNLVEKKYSEATKEKMLIEQKQRDSAAERRRKAVEFIPKHFDRRWEGGIPRLTDDGWNAVREELEDEGRFVLEEFELPAPSPSEDADTDSD
ncbi:hypothetical protein APHAL10511_002498 [Amanita phalloides]|nr:hypothetical protein APHAL10511_002498 [Amanita phalloides]